MSLMSGGYSSFTRISIAARSSAGSRKPLISFAEGQDVGEQRDRLHAVRLRHPRQLGADPVGERRGDEPDVAGLELAQLHRGRGVADHREAEALQHRRDRDVRRRAPRREQQVDPVLRDQLLVDACRLRGIALVVVLDELHRAPRAGDGEAAACVDLAAPQLVGVQLRRGCGGEDPGLGDREADAQRPRRLRAREAATASAPAMPAAAAPVMNERRVVMNPSSSTGGPSAGPERVC
ncbi:MAG: hypothetical protein M5U08_02000 [Burkholderiales bacterium]|nr:hypothetical protein [Burkholderiales bacterium]